MTTRLLPGLLMLLYLTTPAQPACRPAEEGQSTEITCDASLVCPDGTDRPWYIGQSGREIDLSGDLFEAFNITGSVVTFDPVSRSFPFNIEDKWMCTLCNGSQVIACDKFQVYARPEDPRCTVSVLDPVFSDNLVVVSCSTSKVYPLARCSFYHLHSTNTEEERVSLSVRPSYEHPETGHSPVYYRSQCSVSVPAQDLGEGTHSFQGYIYPDVPGGESLVTALTPDRNVTFTFPQTTHNCFPDLENGYVRGESTRCVCRLTTTGYPEGRARWYLGDVDQSSDAIDVVHDAHNHEQVYTCEGVSVLGRKVGSTLTAKFSFLDTDSVEIEPSGPTFNLCHSGSNDTLNTSVVCRVPRGSVSPAPTFTVALDGLEFPEPETGILQGQYYQYSFHFWPEDGGGEYKFTCRVSTGQSHHDKRFIISYREPPTDPPQLKLQGQTYIGWNQSDTVVMTGTAIDVECSVRGGYPTAHNTQLRCGQNLTASGDGNNVTLRISADHLATNLSQIWCACSSHHVSGCYNKQTNLDLNVTYPPFGTFTMTSPQTVYDTGDNVTFTCAVRGNPGPISLLLIRERPMAYLQVVRSTGQWSEVWHTLDNLSCVDAGFYYCDAHNSLGTRRLGRLSIVLRCPLQLIEPSKQPQIINAVTGTNVQFTIGVYGFPEPYHFRLVKFSGGHNLLLSSRYAVTYTPGVAPFGEVTVTVYDFSEGESTYYILTMYNGWGPELTYDFLLSRVSGNDVKSDSILEFIIGGLFVAIIATLIVIIVCLVRRNRHLRKKLKSQDKLKEEPNLQESYDHLDPRETTPYQETPPIAPTSPPPTRDQYEYIDNLDLLSQPEPYVSVPYQDPAHQAIYMDVDT